MRPEFVLIFRWQVHDNQAVDPCGGHICGEFFPAIGVDRIVITHQNDGGIAVVFPEC